MTHIYTMGLTKTIAGTVDIEADSFEEAYQKANDGEWLEKDIQLNENDSFWGTDEWMPTEVVEVDGEPV